MTIDAPRKSSEALAFFRDWDRVERARFLMANHIDYVLTTDREAAGSLERDPGLRLIGRKGGAALFEVTR